MLRIWISLLLATSFASAEPADWIYSARYVLTMDPQRRVIEDGAVAVRGDRIAAVGTKTEIDRRFQAARRLHRPDSVLLPGLINTHTHAAMSLFRGIADDMRLQDWLEKYIFPAEARNVTADFVRWGTRLACLEMMLSGTTTFTDMYYFEDVVAEAAREAGLRGVLGQTVIGFPAPDFKTPGESLRFTEKFIQRFQNDPLIVPAVAPHAVYTVSKEMLQASRDLADRYGVPLLIHLSETEQENKDAAAKWGMTPSRYLNSLGIFNGRTVAAHAVWVDEQDIQVLLERGVGVAHCPSSNMKLASGAAPVARMLKAGIAVGLGPDGPAGSNNDFSMFEEMDLAAKLQKVITRDPRAVQAVQALEMATILGARALDMESDIGSLEGGKRADFITIRLDRPHAVPLYHIYSQLVYASKGADVQDVVVNGKAIVQDGQPLTLDWKQVRARAEEFRAKILKSLDR